MYLPAMDDRRAGVLVPAVRIYLLDKKVKKVAHRRDVFLNMFPVKKTRIVFPELDVILCHLPHLTRVFDVERSDLELILVGNHLPKFVLFTCLRRIARIFLVDDVLNRVFVYACHNDATFIAQYELLCLVNATRPVLSAFFHSVFLALGEIEDSSTVGLPYL